MLWDCSVEHDRNADVLPLQRVCVSEGAYVDGVFEPLDNKVDVAGIDLHPCFVDFLAFSPRQMQKAAVIQKTDVSRQEPAV